MTHSLKYGDLLARQRELQVLGDMPLPSLAQVRVALLAELGELVQELKPLWCWWSRPGPQRVVTASDVLGKAADVLHFLLLLDLAAHGGLNREKRLAAWAFTSDIASDLNDIVSYALSGKCADAAYSLCSVVAYLGFTPDDLVKAYWDKTEVNLQRWRDAAEEQHAHR